MLRVIAAFVSGMYVGQSEPNAPKIKECIVEIVHAVKDSELYKEMRKDPPKK